eukprot:4337989-Pleurochrysis_carterae.AAC.1
MRDGNEASEGKQGSERRHLPSSRAAQMSSVRRAKARSRMLRQIERRPGAAAASLRGVSRSLSRVLRTPLFALVCALFSREQREGCDGTRVDSRQHPC